MLAYASKQCMRDTGVPGFAQAPLDVLLHSLIPVEIAIDEISRFIRRDSQLLSQSKRRLPVNDSKINGLGAGPLLWRDRSDRQTQHFRRGPAVNVFPCGERFRQSLIAGQVRHNTQLHLRIIGRDECPPWLWNEGSADF